MADLTGHLHILDPDLYRVSESPGTQPCSVSDLQRFEDEIERRVRQRTAKLEKINRRLVEENTFLKSLVRKDGLTDLYNHAAMLELIREKIEENLRYRIPLSLLILDIDHFKAVNDTYGHVFGDHVLKRVAGFIRSTIRNVDSAGRIGGEEFAVLLPNTDRKGGVATAEKIRKGIASLSWEERSCRITVSVGVARYLEGSAEAFTEVVDRYLYLAKELGRNRVVSMPYIQMALPLGEVNR